jgi:hypothetical protein
MNRSILVVVSFLVSLVACSGFPFFRGAEQSPSVAESAAGRQVSPAQAILELQNVQYDGEFLSGRLLVGVAEGRLTFDRRLVENATIEAQSVWECSTGQPATFVHADSFPKPAREEDLLTLTPGYWYGANVRFFLFDAEFTGTPAPDCIEVELALRAARGSVEGSVRVRAERSPRHALDAGTPMPPDACGAGVSDGGCGVGAPDASLPSSPEARAP